MRPIATDRLAWSVGPAYVCLSVTTVSCAKVAEPIVIPFRVGPRNHVLDGPDPPIGRGNFEGGVMANCKV